MSKSFTSFVAAACCALSLLAAVTTLPGCATYANYPPIGEDLAVNDPNVAPLPRLIELAVAHVTKLYPADGAFVINFPQGMTRSHALRITKLVSPNAEIVLPGNASLPTYHVSRIWLRADRATIDVLRPVTDVAAPSGAGSQPIVQAITVKLSRTSFSPWRVSSTREWTVGAAVPPERFGWPEDFAPPADSAPSSTSPTTTQN